MLQLLRLPPGPDRFLEPMFCFVLALFSRKLSLPNVVHIPAKAPPNIKRNTLSMFFAPPLALALGLFPNFLIAELDITIPVFTCGLETPPNTLALIFDVMCVCLLGFEQHGG